MTGKPSPWASIALFCFLFLTCITSLSAQDRDLRRAHSYLKKHLKSLEKEYGFSGWDKRLQKALTTHAKLSGQATEKGGLKPSFHGKLKNFGEEVSQLRDASLAFNGYLNQLNIVALGSRIDGYFKEDGKSFPLEKRLEFQRQIRSDMLEKMKEVRFYQMRLSTLDNSFTQVKAEWLFAYSLEYLSGRVQQLLGQHRFHENEAVYDDYSLQLSYWTQALTGDASQAQQRIQEMHRSYEGRKSEVLGNLHDLLEVLNTDMLFSDLLAQAGKDGVEFTLAVEDRIESSLKSQSGNHLLPIRQRIDGWRRLENNIRDGLARAVQARESQREQMVAQEQRMRMEAERMAALRAEQERMERERKKRLDQALSALSNFDLKAGSDLRLDQEAQHALSQKSTQKLKSTTHVGSAQKKLHVPKQQFSDTLTHVQKFVVEDSKADLSNLSLDERSAQSLYVYASPEGRTSRKDLEQFVNDIALSSFGTDQNFFSYQAPPAWTPGTRLQWMPDKHAPKEVKDREFSFVGLVVDAHKKRADNTRETQSVGAINLPPNMLIVLTPQGRVVRFQAFSDIKNLSISRGDLVDGKLHYKFLNYSADNRNIYLNGIDHEVKVSSPNGKS